MTPWPLPGAEFNTAEAEGKDDAEGACRPVCKRGMELEDVDTAEEENEAHAKKEAGDDDEERHDEDEDADDEGKNACVWEELGTAVANDRVRSADGYGRRSGPGRISRNSIHSEIS